MDGKRAHQPSQAVRAISAVRGGGWFEWDSEGALRAVSAVRAIGCFGYGGSQPATSPPKAVSTVSAVRDGGMFLMGMEPSKGCRVGRGCFGWDGEEAL